MNTFFDLVKNTRSYRRFDGDYRISEESLRDLIELARISASGANMQALKFFLSSAPESNERIFPSLSWAGYLSDWTGPEEGERPSAYILILGDTEIKKSFGQDPGISAWSILLGAAEKGLGGCMIGSIDKEKLRSALAVPKRYQIELVVALGKPTEEVLLEEVGEDGSIKYWRDQEGRHHVPKRSLSEIIVSPESW